jgi:hypothetical protein
MRACFLGQNICGLGFGVATLRTPPLVMDQPASELPPDRIFQPESGEDSLSLSTVDQHVSLPSPVLPVFSDTQAVANSPRLTA